MSIVGRDPWTGTACKVNIGAKELAKGEYRSLHVRDVDGVVSPCVIIDGWYMHVTTWANVYGLPEAEILAHYDLHKKAKPSVEKIGDGLYAVSDLHGAEAALLDFTNIVKSSNGETIYSTLAHRIPKSGAFLLVLAWGMGLRIETYSMSDVKNAVAKF